MDHLKFHVQFLHHSFVNVKQLFDHVKRRELNLTSDKSVVLDEIAVKKVFNAAAQQLS